MKCKHGLTSENEDSPLHLWEAYIYLLAGVFKRFGLDQLNNHLTTNEIKEYLKAN